MNKQLQTFSFNPAINLSEENKYLLAMLKDELEEILSISDYTPYHLQHEKIGPRIIEAYRN